MQNVEFKAELRDAGLARDVCRVLDAKHLGLIEQVDTYYKMPDGRLKRRQTPGEQVEWIFYHRPNRTQPKVSTFTILSDRQAVTRWGTLGLRAWVTVRKKRDLWLIDNTRIHLDEVERLGRFIEFESLITERYNLKECQAIVRHLRERFGPSLGEPIASSYCDMMAGEVEEGVT